MGPLKLALVVIWIFSFTALPGSDPLRAPAQAANPRAVVIQTFENRISEYVKLQKSIQSKLATLKPTNSATEIVDHQHELAQKLREARKTSSQGEIFTPQVKQEFQQLIASTMRGENGVRIKTSLANADPVKFPLDVNADYPPGVPLQSTPPTLLVNLPKLPPELEYRIVGGALVLRDVNANLVIDFMAEAIP